VPYQNGFVLPLGRSTDGDATTDPTPGPPKGRQTEPD
jgi:hypothetical protein